MRAASAREQAAAAAGAAASRGGLDVIALDDVELLQQASDLFTAVWSASPENPLIPTNILRALAHAGNYVYGAMDEDQMIGAIVGFLGRLDGGLQLHSHILGVSPRAQGRSVGFALKLHQRAWALDHDIDVVTWTFDPLVRRNAYFNVTKLGAAITEYHANFYGPMQDGINDDDQSDRVVVQWRLDAEEVAAASEGRPLEPDLRELQHEGAQIALLEDDAGEPEISDARAPVLLVSIPEDIVRIRGESRASADRWRAALREVLGGALRDGYHAVGMTRSGWYVLRSER